MTDADFVHKVKRMLVGDSGIDELAHDTAIEMLSIIYDECERNVSDMDILYDEYGVKRHE